MSRPGPSSGSAGGSRSTGRPIDVRWSESHRHDAARFQQPRIHTKRGGNATVFVQHFGRHVVHVHDRLIAHLRRQAGGRIRSSFAAAQRTAAHCSAPVPTSLAHPWFARLAPVPLPALLLRHNRNSWRLSQSSRSPLPRCSCYKSNRLSEPDAPTTISRHTRRANGHGIGRDFAQHARRLPSIRRDGRPSFRRLPNPGSVAPLESESSPARLAPLSR